MPVPDGPARTRFSARPSHSSVASACWVGSGMADSVSRQLSSVLPDGKPAARRRIAVVAASRPAASSSEQDPEHLGRIPALGAGGRADLGCRPPDVRQAQPVEDRGELGRQGRRRRRVHRPKPAQAPVPGWTLNASSSAVAARAGSRPARWSRIDGEVGLGEPPRRGRGRERGLDPLARARTCGVHRSGPLARAERRGPAEPGNLTGSNDAHSSGRAGRSTRTSRAHRDNRKEPRSGNKNLVSVFDTEATAFEGLTALKDLHRDGDVTVYASTVIAKDAVRGPCLSARRRTSGPIGTVVGIVTGGLVGLLGGPAGVAVGAYVGGVGGLMYDLFNAGVSMDFVDEVSSLADPGQGRRHRRHRRDVGDAGRRAPRGSGRGDVPPLARRDR